MKKSLIAMTSITYAMKAKNLLNGLKYYCEISENCPKTSEQAAATPYQSPPPPKR